MNPTFHPTQPSGSSALVGFHDGHLTGIRQAGGSLHIWCSTLGHEQYRIVVPELTRLLLNGFTGANIIHSITVYEAHATPMELFAAVSELDSPQWASLLNERFDGFSKSKECLIEVATSDGATLLLTASAQLAQVTIQRESGVMPA